MAGHKNLQQADIRGLNRNANFPAGKDQVGEFELCAITVGVALRGHPCLEFHARVATEGHPYSCFYVYSASKRRQVLIVVKE